MFFFRFRIHRKDLPGSPDIVLPKYKTVVLYMAVSGIVMKVANIKPLQKQERSFGKINLMRI